MNMRLWKRPQTPTIKKNGSEHETGEGLKQKIHSRKMVLNMKPEKA
jgi:hypothetical protein